MVVRKNTMKGKNKIYTSCGRGGIHYGADGTGIEQVILKTYVVRQRSILHHGAMSSVLVEKPCFAGYITFSKQELILN